MWPKGKVRKIIRIEKRTEPVTEIAETKRRETGEKIRELKEEIDPKPATTERERMKNTDLEEETNLTHFAIIT